MECNDTLDKIEVIKIPIKFTITFHGGKVNKLRLIYTLVSAILMSHKHFYLYNQTDTTVLTPVISPKLRVAISISTLGQPCDLNEIRLT